MAADLPLCCIIRSINNSCIDPGSGLTISVIPGLPSSHSAMSRPVESMNTIDLSNAMIRNRPLSPVGKIQPNMVF